MTKFGITLNYTYSCNTCVLFDLCIVFDTFKSKNWHISHPQCSETCNERHCRCHAWLYWISLNSQIVLAWVKNCVAPLMLRPITSLSSSKSSSGLYLSVYLFLVVWCYCCDVWPAECRASLPQYLLILLCPVLMCVHKTPLSWSLPLVYSPWLGQRKRNGLHVNEPLRARVQSRVRPPAGKFSHSCYLPYRLSHKEGNKLWLVGEQRGGHSVVRLPQVAHATVITECLSPCFWPVQHELCLLSLCAILFGPGSEEVLLVTADSSAKLGVVFCAASTFAHPPPRQCSPTILDSLPYLIALKKYWYCNKAKDSR